jgi:hypothetical protein
MGTEQKTVTAYTDIFMIEGDWMIVISSDDFDLPY